MKKCGLQYYIAQRGGPERITIGRITCYLFQAEILVGAWSVERHVPDVGEKLWEADHMLPEVAKLLVGLPRYGMTLNTPRRAEKEQRAALLRLVHRGRVAARKLIDRGVGKRQTELELGDRSGEHFVGDRRAVLHVAKAIGEKPPIL